MSIKKIYCNGGNNVAFYIEEGTKKGETKEEDTKDPDPKFKNFIPDSIFLEYGDRKVISLNVTDVGFYDKISDKVSGANDIIFFQRSNGFFKFDELEELKSKKDYFVCIDNRVGVISNIEFDFTILDSNVFDSKLLLVKADNKNYLTFMIPPNNPGLLKKELHKLLTSDLPILCIGNIGFSGKKEKIQESFKTITRYVPKEIKTYEYTDLLPPVDHYNTIPKILKSIKTQNSFDPNKYYETYLLNHNNLVSYMVPIVDLSKKNLGEAIKKFEMEKIINLFSQQSSNISDFFKIFVKIDIKRDISKIPLMKDYMKKIYEFKINLIKNVGDLSQLFGKIINENEGDYEVKLKKDRLKHFDSKIGDFKRDLDKIDINEYNKKIKQIDSSTDEKNVNDFEEEKKSDIVNRLSDFVKNLKGKKPTTMWSMQTGAQHMDSNASKLTKEVSGA